MRIKVIASCPDPEQDGIEEIIGQEFKVEIEHEDSKGNKTGEVSIGVSWGGAYGLITLNKNEYVVVNQ